MILAAQEVKGEAGVDDRLDRFGVVDIVLGLEAVVLHGAGLDGEVLDDVLGQRLVGAGGRGGQPGAAPVVRLRAVDGSPVAIGALAGLGAAGVADHRPLDAPGGEEVAHDGVVADAGVPRLAPRIGHSGEVLVAQGLGKVEVPLDLVVDHEVHLVINPRGGAHRADNLPHVAVGRDQLGRAGGLLVHLACGRQEGIPILDLLLHLLRGLHAEVLLSEAAAIEEQAGGRLPGGALDLAVAVGGDGHGVGILLGQLIRRDADLLEREGVVGIDILERVVRLDEEHVDVLTGAERRVQLLLIDAVVVRVDDELDLVAVGQGHGAILRDGAADGRDVVILEHALELIVPGVDDELFAGGRDIKIGGVGFRHRGNQRAHHHDGHDQGNDFFHECYLLFIVHPSRLVRGR